MYPRKMSKDSTTNPTNGVYETPSLIIYTDIIKKITDTLHLDYQIVGIINEIY